MTAVHHPSPSSSDALSMQHVMLRSLKSVLYRVKVGRYLQALIGQGLPPYCTFSGPRCLSTSLTTGRLATIEFGNGHASLHACPLLCLSASARATESRGVTSHESTATRPHCGPRLRGISLMTSYSQEFRQAAKACRFAET